LNIIRGVKVNVNGAQLPALELIVKPGFYSSPENLTYSYNITGFTSRLLTLQINFDNPLLVSSFDDPDYLRVKFNGYYFFFSEDARTIAKGTLLEKALPRM